MTAPRTQTPPAVTSGRTRLTAASRGREPRREAVTRPRPSLATRSPAATLTVDRLVAVRVEIAGGGALHRIESSRPGQLEAELRAVAGELPGARVWIEKVSCTLRPDYDRTLLAAGTDTGGS